MFFCDISIEISYSFFTDIFFLLSFESSLCILDTNPLSGMNFVKKKTSPYGLSFYSLSCVFWRADVFDFVAIADLEDYPPDKNKSITSDSPKKAEEYVARS